MTKRQYLGLNSKLVKKDGKIEEDVYKVGGLYGPALEKIIYHLEKAANVAAKMISKKNNRTSYRIL